MLTYIFAVACVRRKFSLKKIFLCLHLIFALDTPLGFRYILSFVLKVCEYAKFRKISLFGEHFFSRISFRHILSFVLTMREHILIYWFNFCYVLSFASKDCENAKLVIFCGISHFSISLLIKSEESKKKKLIHSKLKTDFLVTNGTK